VDSGIHHTFREGASSVAMYKKKLRQAREQGGGSSTTTVNVFQSLARCMLWLCSFTFCSEAHVEPFWLPIR